MPLSGSRDKPCPPACKAQPMADPLFGIPVRLCPPASFQPPEARCQKSAMPKPNKLRIKHRLPPGLGTRTHKDQRKESSRIACRKTKGVPRKLCFEGGSVVTEERDGQFLVHTNEETLLDMLSPEDREGIVGKTARTFAIHSEAKAPAKK